MNARVDHPRDVQGEQLIPRITEVSDSSTASDPAFLRHWAISRDRDRAIEEVHERTELRLRERGTGLALAGSDLSGIDLSRFDLRCADLNRAQLHRTNLADCCLAEATLICTGMESSSFDRADLSGVYMHALAAQVCSFREAKLEGLSDVTGALFHGCDLTNASFRGSSLSGTTFYQSQLTGLDLRLCQLQGARFNESRMERCNLRGSQISETSFLKCWMEGADLSQTRGESATIQRPPNADGLALSQASLPALGLAGVRARNITAQGLSAPGSWLHHCHLNDVRLDGADLTGISIQDCTIEGCLDHALMTGANVLSSRLNRASMVGVYAENAHFVESSLIEADCSNIRARCLVMRDCDLSNINFSNAYLYRSMITGDPPNSMAMRNANMRGANLVQAYVAADLRGGDLSHAHAAYARLNQCCLAGVKLLGVNLYEASLIKTDLTEADLTGSRGPYFAHRCKGLEAALMREGSEETLSHVRALAALLRVSKRTST
jgi:uncharacterized protein YjbI with pentapeptide repeats